MQRLKPDKVFLAAVNRSCLVCNEFQPRPFLRLTEPTPAEAAARRATAALAAAAGDAPVRGDASTPPIGEDEDGGNAAALAAAPDARDPTVCSAAGANAAALPPFTATPPGVPGAPPDSVDAATPPLGETADAADAAALEALTAALPSAASAAAVAAAEVPDIDGAFVVEREATRFSEALAVRSLALGSRSRRSISFLRHCSASPVSRTPLAFQTSMSARSMAVPDKDLRAAAVVAAFLWIAMSVEAAALAAFVPIGRSWKRPRRLPTVELESSSEMSSTPPSGTGRRPRAAAAVAAAPDAPLNLSHLRMTIQHLTQSAPLAPPFITTKTGAPPSLLSTCTASYRFSASK